MSGPVYEFFSFTRFLPTHSIQATITNKLASKLKEKKLLSHAHKISIHTLTKFKSKVENDPLFKIELLKSIVGPKATWIVPIFPAFKLINS